MNKPPIRLRTTDAFDRSIKRLSKKYRNVGKDLESLIERLRAGETPGDQIPGVGYPVYKERLPNRDSQSGQSGGYRVIYYVQTETAVYLIEIYAKGIKENIQPETIRRIIAEEIEPPVE